ncbi:UbiE methyltransferase [Venustampulla echinocandica]|uniref:UbiE methyltransferase n=1 Tax=Venustampulla echinocandica TaxID=2656787 RepID=A0A370TQQ2_9HELO|nr:UbiE methyltransferase [Venustampulla echinocandica]RDL37847.1 UbiE methyltransferase [Venustampulla echinocandica]
MKILDVGCGPGSITIGLARLVPEGDVIGLDYTSTQFPEARVLAAEQSISNVHFQQGDIHKLPFEDGTFDFVTGHQILQHIQDPVQGLKEMRRVTKPGGFVAVREGASMTWYPPSPGMSQWQETTAKVGSAMGANLNAGNKLHVWAREAGFKNEGVKCSAGTWCFRTKDERDYIGGSMADRVLPGTKWGDIAVQKEICTKEDLEAMSRMWREWVDDEDGWFAILHGEIVCSV